MHSAVAHATRVEQPRGAAEMHLNCATARVATQRSRVGKNGWTCHTCGDFTCVTLLRTPAVADHSSWPRRSALQRRPRSRCRPRAEWRLDAPCDLYASSRANRRSERRRARESMNHPRRFVGVPGTNNVISVLEGFIITSEVALVPIGFDRLRHPPCMRTRQIVSSSDVLCAYEIIDSIAPLIVVKSLCAVNSRS